LGQRPQQVADALGVSYWVILWLLRRTAPKLLPKQQQPSLSEAQADEARALLAAGWSLRKIGRRCGVSNSAIWRLIQRDRAGDPTQQSEGTKAGGETG
jgi:lambda repressor-like predicted transcriptional regulator